MKLKKIVSLAMAGLMAVSMLTACGGKEGNGQQPPEDNGNSTGYSAMLAEAVSDEVKEMDYVTFKDDAKVGEALEDALGNLSDVSTIVTSLLGGGQFDVDDAVGADFKDTLKLRDMNDWQFDADRWMNDTRKVGNIFCYDGSIDMEKAMKMVAEELETQLEGLDEYGVAQNDTSKYEYNYTVSVSVVNKSSNAIDWLHTSANFIAVTVTRTGTPVAKI